MKKEYNGKSLVYNSRYRDYFPTISEENQEKVINCIDKLIKENKEYCDKGNYNHLANIFTSIALYQTMQQDMTKEQAFNILSEHMWKFVEKGANK